MTDGPGRVGEVSAQEAIRLVRDEGAYLLDVREQQEWDEVHIHGAHLLPMSEIESRQDELPTDRADETLLVICHSGYRSAMVARALVAAGWQASNVAGGMMAWQSAGGVVAEPGA